VKAETDPEIARTASGRFSAVTITISTPLGLWAVVSAATCAAAGAKAAIESADPANMAVFKEFHRKSLMRSPQQDVSIMTYISMVTMFLQIQLLKRIRSNNNRSLAKPATRSTSKCEP
jgi:hypothetical protein